MFDPCFVVRCLVSLIFNFCNGLAAEEIAGCFTLNVFLLSCGWKCSVCLPRSALGWSVLSQCLWHFLVILTCQNLLDYAIYLMKGHHVFYGVESCCRVLEWSGVRFRNGVQL